MTDFPDFWRLYPRKVAKLDALKAWRQMTRDYDPAEIIAGLERTVAGLLAKDRQYIPYPATWLRAGRWMDEPDETNSHNYISAARKIAHGLEDAYQGGLAAQRLPAGHGRH